MDIRYNVISIKPKHQPRIGLKTMQRLGDIDTVTSAAQWMQATIETDNDLEHQCKDYAYEEADRQDLITLQEEENNMI